MTKKAFDQAKNTPGIVQSSMIGLYYWIDFLSRYDDDTAFTPIKLPDLSSLIVDKNWGPPPGEQRAPTSREYAPVPESHTAVPVGDETWEGFLDHLLDREGYRNKVYLDSQGKPTVGVGHLVKPEDGLKVGDTISDEQVRDLLEQDAAKAYRAAIEQANELGINDSEFVVALGSVNYQLGTGWRNKFPQTWQSLKDGDYEQAMNNIEKSLWARQTPVRTADFTAAIDRVASGHFNQAVAYAETEAPQPQNTPEEPAVMNAPAAPSPGTPA